MKNPIIPHYFGSKNVNGVYQFIINHIPEHKHYVEGFLGSGKILLTKKPASGYNCGIDIDSAVIDKFNNAFRYPQSYLTLVPCSTVEFICGSFIDIFDHWRHGSGINLADLKDTFVYLDPTYLLDTRTSSHRYKHELTLFDHTELLNYVRSLPCSIVISCYDNSLYSSMLAGWNKAHVKSMTRGGVRMETIYFNYESSGKLHDTRFVGKDFTDRQRIKRKIERNINKILKLPAQEQQAFLEAVKEKFFLPGT